jgi:hypothetical protein
VLRGLAIVFAIVGLLAISAELYLRSRERAHWHRVEAAAERELLNGGLRGLLRARAIALGGASIVDDAEPAATIALASAMLVSEYGLDEAQAARAAADSVEAAPRASQRAHSLKLASRALLALAAGRLDDAEAVARQSLSLGHKQASPLFVLGRVRFRQGNLATASHAFQAALVREPSFTEARVAWAELWLEQGEPERAKENLLKVLQATPEHGRARLLLAEANGAAPHGNGAPDWAASCARDESQSSFLAGACALARAQQAARADDRAGEILWAEIAARQRPVEPRVLGGAAQVLASLGAVDRASACFDEAKRIASPSLSSVWWAQVGVDLGRGRLVDLTSAPKLSSSPWAPAFLARNALASGGIKALTAALRQLPRDAIEVDAFAALVEDGPQRASGPLRDYLDGMRARLGGKTALAADLLAKALQDHGDACRAAGEYLAACRELGRTPDDNALSWLRRENAHCVNLPSVDRPRNSAVRITH